jgi:hypothetical protein
MLSGPLRLAAIATVRGCVGIRRKVLCNALKDKDCVYNLLHVQQLLSYQISATSSPSFPLQTKARPPSFARILNMHPILLLTRANKGNKDSNSTSDNICPTEDTTGPPIVNFVGNFTYHELSTILSGSCAILSTIIVLVLVSMHAANYSNAIQQRQIIRIALLVPWVALFSFLIVWLDEIGEYLVESLDAGCAIALSAFLLFMCDLVLSHPGGFEDLFRQVPQPKSGARDRNSPQSLRVSLANVYHTTHN